MKSDATIWCFRDRPAVIGMVHLQALPGTPRSRKSVMQIAADAASQAETLVKAGFRSLLIENMHDAPYVAGPHGPEITAAITAAALAVRDAAPDATIGLQVLARGERIAFAVALACDARFVRCENFVFSHVADEGLMVEASAGPLLRYRREIGAEGVRIFADIKKKHASHAITQDVSLADVVHGAEFFGADGVVITGSATGRSASLDDVEAARKAGPLPVLVGSGVTPANVKAMLRHAHGVIVGSSLKVGGVWNAPLDERACEAFIEACRAAS